MNVIMCRLFLVAWCTAGVHSAWQHAAGAWRTKIVCDSTRL